MNNFFSHTQVLLTSGQFATVAIDVTFACIPTGAINSPVLVLAIRNAREEYS
jgi:hypothetical protein